MKHSNVRDLVDRSTFVRLYRFAVVGSSAALVQTVLLWALVEHVGLNYLPAAALAIETTIILQYVVNNAWTFQHSQHTSPFEYLVGLLRTNVVRGTAIPIQIGILYALVTWTGLMYLLSNGVAIFLSGFYRYYLDSRWAWKIQY